ncbi:hypothetical protein [Nocardioides limicola]|uniref:hypothetical protein n=1 Tax=Nocardioides limicola TaxID=2803368 RepID=UPI00193B29DD|nr:hypothetical protein [Nocardioides sp. DJM-14]
MKRSINIGHLVMGVAFLGLVAVWLLLETGVVDDFRWLLPLPWLAAGVVGLLVHFWTHRHPEPSPSYVDTSYGPGFPDVTLKDPIFDNQEEK